MKYYLRYNRLILLLVTFHMLLPVSSKNYKDYYYSSYDENVRSQMFIAGASLPTLHVPYTIAVLNQTYCTITQTLLGKVDQVYLRMLVERNAHLRVVCNYTAPQSISQAIQLYEKLQGKANTLDGVDALMGDYNPLVSTIASSLNLTFIIVDAESDTLNKRLQEISSFSTQSPAGSVLGSYADLNNYTFVPDTFWYRTFLYGSILDPTGLGQQVFGSSLQNFLQIGVICDDSVLLSQFVAVDKGPFVTSLVTMQLDSLYPPTAAALNNVSAVSMDSWTSKFANVTALMISTNSTYSMMLLPQILQSLLNVGYFTPQSLTVLTNLYINSSLLLQYSDLNTLVYGMLSPSSFEIYDFPYPAYNVSLPPPPGFIPAAQIVIDPLTQALSTGLYFLSMRLLQVVYQPSYIAYAIQTQNWPSIPQQHYFLKASITFGVAQLQYNRCSYMITVLQVQSSSCNASELTQSPLNILGYWKASNFLIDTDYTYKSTNTNSSTVQSFTQASNLSINSLMQKSLRVGVVVDNPWIISCQECAAAYEGYAIDILGNLSLILKFNYTLVYQSAYTVLMANLASGKLDLGLGGITWTNNTMATYGYNVTLMTPFLNSGLNLLIRNDTVAPWWSWLSPYSNVLWFVMLVLAVLLTFAFMILDTIDPNRLGTRLFDFFASYWYVFGAFTQSAVEIMPITIGTKLLSMIMWFTVIIYVSAFTAAYTSSLIIANTPPFVDTLSAALNYYRSSYDPYYFIANSSAAQYLRTSYPDLYARAMQSPSSYVVGNAFDAAGHLLRRSTLSGLVGDARVNQWMSNLVKCRLVTVGDLDGAYSTYYSIIAMPPDTPYFNTIHKELINLERLRVLTTMRKFYFDSLCEVDLPPSALNLEHLAGIYIALAIGSAISVVSTFVFMFIKKLQLRAERDLVQRHAPFHFGHYYVARIHIVRDAGVLLKIYRTERDERKASAGKKPEFSPLQYSMLLQDLNVGNTIPKKPHQLGLREGGRILVKYLGVSPDSDNDRFIFYKVSDTDTS